MVFLNICDLTASQKTIFRSPWSDIYCHNKNVHDALTLVDKPSEYRKYVGSLSFDDYCRLADIVYAHVNRVSIRKITEDAGKMYLSHDEPLNIAVRYTINGMADLYETVYNFPEGLNGVCARYMMRFDESTQQKYVVGIGSHVDETDGVYYFDECKKYALQVMIGRYDQIERIWVRENDCEFTTYVFTVTYQI